jgi:hypothetical protein
MKTNEEYYKYYLEEKKRDLKRSIISRIVTILLTGGAMFLMFRYLDGLTILAIGAVSPFALMVILDK